MKHTVLKDSFKSNGTSLQGGMDVSYARLVEIFGEPEDGDGYKVQKEWTIEFEDGEIATIYDWKWGYEYNGDFGTHYTQVPTWNIGGNSKVVVDRIKELVEQYQSTIDLKLTQSQYDSLKIVIDYVMEIELRHYEENGDCPDHIYLKAKEVLEVLK